MRRLLLHHLLAGRTLQLPRCLPRLHDPGERKKLSKKNFMPSQVKRAASVLARLHECKYLLLSLVVITVLPAIPELFIRFKSWSLFISNLPPGPLWSPLVRASAFSPQGLIVEREKKTFVLKVFSPGTPCTPCTSSSNCSYATSSPLSLSSSASSDQGAVLSQIISQKNKIFQDFCRQENLFDLPWRASSLRVWSLWSRTDQTS